MRLLRKLFGHSPYALDPKRTAAARRDFDVERGFDSYAEFCRTRLARPIPAGKDEIAARGVELVPILTGARAAEMLASLESASSGIQPNDKGIDYSEVLAFDHADALLPVFEEMLRGPLDQKLLRQFGSEYLIYSYAVIRTLPRSGTRRSFLWHCDRGPRRFLKVLMYLNGTESHGGNTEFLDRSATQEFERLGYVFGPNKRRSDDLAPLARKNGLRYEPRMWPIKAGEALLFEPAGALHRGIMPSRGNRYLLSLMLTPSPMPWRQAFAATARTRFCETNAGSWPAHARDLLAAIGFDPDQAPIEAAA